MIFHVFRFVFGQVWAQTRYFIVDITGMKCLETHLRLARCYVQIDQIINTALSSPSCALSGWYNALYRVRSRDTSCHSGTHSSCVQCDGRHHHHLHHYPYTSGDFRSRSGEHPSKRQRSRHSPERTISATIRVIFRLPGTVEHRAESGSRTIDQQSFVKLRAVPQHKWGE
jgi:hypothetical protein